MEYVACPLFPKSRSNSRGDCTCFTKSRECDGLMLWCHNSFCDVTILLWWQNVWKCETVNKFKLTHISNFDATYWLVGSEVTDVIAISYCDNFNNVTVKWMFPRPFFDLSICVTYLLCFQGYDMSHTLSKWSSLNFASHWVVMATYLFYLLMWTFKYSYIVDFPEVVVSEEEPHNSLYTIIAKTIFASSANWILVISRSCGWNHAFHIRIYRSTHKKTMVWFRWFVVYDASTSWIIIYTAFLCIKRRRYCSSSCFYN